MSQAHSSLGTLPVINKERVEGEKMASSEAVRALERKTFDIGSVLPLQSA